MSLVTSTPTIPNRWLSFNYIVPDHVPYANGTGVMVDLGIFPNTRNIAIPNTIAGTTYSARIQAIGGSTLCSPWSAVMTLMST